MKTRLFLVLVSALWATVSVSLGAKGDQKGLEPLQGSWEVVKADPAFEASRLTFRGDQPRGPACNH
jgi:hypothetical protein